MKFLTTISIEITQYDECIISSFLIEVVLKSTKCPKNYFRTLLNQNPSSIGIFDTAMLLKFVKYITEVTQVIRSDNSQVNQTGSH